MNFCTISLWTESGPVKSSAGSEEMVRKGNNNGAGI